MKKNWVLVVDDEPGIRESLGGVLEDEGYGVRAVASGEEALAQLSARTYPVVLLDIWLPGMDGLDVLARIQEMEPVRRPAVVVISGHGTIETAVKATKLGAFDFIEKPLSIEKLTVTLKNALERRRLLLENERLKEEVKSKYHIIGESVPMKALRQQLALMAPTNGRVLIYGESGTGKELVAHAIHAQSSRAEEAFVEVNCAAIPEELIESEVFGHIKGSFTGAHEDKVGKFQKADGGTIFLDEVGDMSLKTQAKVLRALEEQRFEPVGAGASVQVDVRVIAATNKNLEEEIERGNFREDLFYRLNVIPFSVPPLRERKEDIPLLVNYFLDEFTATYGRRQKEVTEEAYAALQDYSWPGNVRELKNLIERIVIMNPQVRIDVRHLPLPPTRRAAEIDRRSLPEFASLQEARNAYEREYILKKLE
ncbi:MAG TPA: sigma-54 dependent transcriptional regulator, partial [Bryobacterales bacterium]|nr:sigma-54 dependent transcriptional regulator [Bryobacterales bacterium]